MPHAINTQEDVTSFRGVKLFVNDGLLRPEQVGELRASSPDTPIEELRQRYEEDGYVFLKGLLPREDVLKAREEYFKMLAPSGVLKPGTNPVEGIFDDARDKDDFPGIGAGAAASNGKPGGQTAEKFVDLALEAHYADWYKETFCKHPKLKETVARLSGWGDEHTHGVRRTLLRNNTPGNKAIGVHYDQIFLRYGAPTSYTAWVPMGDISLTGGGLIYLEKGHKLGSDTEAEFTKKAEEAGMTPEEIKYGFNQHMQSNGMLADGPKEYSETFGKRWLVTEYKAGDVVLHSPYTIHASTINFDPNNVIRVGTDLRFVDNTKPMDTVSTLLGDRNLVLTFWSDGTMTFDSAMVSEYPFRRYLASGCSGMRSFVLLDRERGNIEESKKALT